MLWVLQSYSDNDAFSIAILSLSKSFSRGGGPLADWQAASKQHFDLVTDPEAHWRKLVELAMLTHERRQVRSDELSEMLELADAARLWGLVEWEEADGAGLFLEHTVDPDNVSFFAKRDR